MVVKQLRLMRNFLFRLLSFPINLIFKSIPFFFEKLLFVLFKKPSIKLSKDQYPQFIFFVNSLSGKKLGSALMDLLIRFYNVKYISDIIHENPNFFLAETVKKIREEDNVNLQFPRFHKSNE